MNLIVRQADQVWVRSKLGQDGFSFAKDQWPNVLIALDTTETIVERSRLDTLYLDGSGHVLITVAGDNNLSELERDEIFTI